MATKVKALQMWCKKMAEGYRDVDVVNMTSSWKDGLAFCAIIHRFRPDLIDFDSLSKENVFDNNQLAFEVAEKELGIPAFLDASDMVAIRVPDKLSVVTYVSQYCNYFRDKPQLGGPGVKKPSTLKRHQDVDFSGPDAKRQTLTNKDTPAKERQVSMGDKCVICHNKVYLLERHVDNGQLYHRTCFRSSELSPNSKLYKQSDIKSSPHSTVSKQTESPKPEPDFWKRRAEAKKMANESKVKTDSDNKVKVESDKKVKVESEKVSEIKSKTKLNDRKDVTSKMSETKNTDSDLSWRTSRGDNLHLKKTSDDKERKTALNDASKNTSSANKYEKVEKWVPEKKKTEVSKSEESQPKPTPRNIFKMGAKEERVEEPMETGSHLDKPERPKPVPRKNLNNIQTDKTEQKDLKTKLDLNVKKDRSDQKYTHNKTKVDSNVKKFTTDPESPPPLPKSIPPSLPSQPSMSPPQLHRNQPPHLSSGVSSSSSPSSSHVSSTSNKHPEKTKTSESISKTSQQDENHEQKKSGHFKFNLFGKKESHDKDSPRSSKENVESSKSSNIKVESSKSSKDKVESSKSSKDKVEASKSSKDKTESSKSAKEETFKSYRDKLEPPKPTKEKVESPKSSKEKVVPSKERAWSPNNRATSPKPRPMSVDPKGHTKMDVDDAIAFTKQSSDPVAVLMSPSETDKELLGGLLNNLAHIRKKKQDETKKIGDTSHSKSVDVGQLLNKDKDLNKKEVKSWNGDEKVTRKDKTKSSDFVSSKLSVFGENKTDNIKPVKQEVKVDKSSKENKTKSQFYSVDDDDDVPEWKKALERRKEAKRPQSVDILASSSSKTPVTDKVGQSRPDRPKSYDLLADKKTNDKPVWQIEAEKRREARKGGYVDPEKKHMSQDTEKEKQNETNTKKNSQNLLLKDKDNQLNIKTTDSSDKTDRKSRILPVPPSSEVKNTQDPTRKRISVGQKFDFGKVHGDDDDEDTTKVKGKPPRPPPISPGGPKSRDSVSPFLAGKMANFTKSPSPSSPTRDEIKTFGEVKRLSPVEIQQQLKDIDTRLTNLEVRGRHLEDTIRKAQEEEEDEKLMVEWFRLVNEKNELVRKEADLIYVSRAQELEDQQSDINRKIRMLMTKPDHLRTDADKEEEEYLINKLLDIVNQRSLIVDSQDEDRIRYEEEDKDINEILESKGFCQVRPKSALKKEEKILERKKKKKKQKKGKLL